MSTPNERKYAHLRPVVTAWYPTDAAEFRAIYQWDNPRAPEYRLEGLASMTDDQVRDLAQALQNAVIEAPSQIEVLWGAVIDQGRRVTQGGPA